VPEELGRNVLPVGGFLLVLARMVWLTQRGRMRPWLLPVSLVPVVVLLAGAVLLGPAARQMLGLWVLVALLGVLLLTLAITRPALSLPGRR
jgi:hypothetical protein